MVNQPADDPPLATTLSAWRSAVSSRRLHEFRLEDIVAAIQDLATEIDSELLNSLAKHLSDSMFDILRKLVGINHPNHGLDIIDEVHTQLWDALLLPNSADGKALRIAFVPRLKFRIKDALARHGRRIAFDGDPAPGTAVGSTERALESKKRHGGKLIHDSALLNDEAATADPISERLDVEAVLERIPDPMKRMAFRLHMEGVPYKSKKIVSIEETLGVKEATIRVWIENIKAMLSKDQLVLALSGDLSGEKS